MHAICLVQQCFSQLFDGVVENSKRSLDQLRRVELASHVCSMVTASVPHDLDEIKQAIGILESLLSDGTTDGDGKFKPRLPEDAQLLARLEIASLNLKRREVAACEEALAKAAKGVRKLELAGASEGKQPVVQAAFHRVSAELLQVTGPASDFLAEALDYLSLVGADGMRPSQAADWASQLCIAALVDEETYDVGMVVQHPVCEVLRSEAGERSASGGRAWLLDLATACAKGDLLAFNTTAAEHSSDIETTPALAAHMGIVREKITVLALVEFVASKPPQERSVPFSQVAACSGLPVKQVDWLLMRAMSKGLLKGTIDACPELDAGAGSAAGPAASSGAGSDAGAAVGGATAGEKEAGIVHVSYVRPRTLDKGQVSKLCERVEDWIGRVDEAHAFLEDHGKELVQ